MYLTANAPRTGITPILAQNLILVLSREKLPLLELFHPQQSAVFFLLQY